MSLAATRTAPLVAAPLASPASAPTRSEAPPAAGRDGAVDLVRAACLIAVIAVHALMVGVSVSATGPVLENALERWSGFTVFSWCAQMMPLFFIAGGFASATHYRRVRARGERAAHYVASRLGRLLAVPLLAGAVTVIALSVLTVLGVDPEIVATAGWRISQPLWFLGVYVLCSALVPAMHRLNELAPRATLVGLGAGILAVDLTRFITGIDAVGFANLLFVWLFVQQLGFRLADGVAPGPRSAVAATLAAAALITVGASPANLFEALNPPTAVLALLGIIQCAVFVAVRGRLARIAEAPATRRISQAINERSMSIYAWHMLATVLLAGVLLGFGSSLAEPLSDAWWAQRPLWLAAVGAVVGGVLWLVAPLERLAIAWTRASVTTCRTRVACAALAGSGGVLLILATAGAPSAWVCGVALIGLALVLARAGRLERERDTEKHTVSERGDARELQHQDEFAGSARRHRDDRGRDHGREHEPHEQHARVDATVEQRHTKREHHADDVEDARPPLPDAHREGALASGPVRRDIAQVVHHEHRDCEEADTGSRDPHLLIRDLGL